MSQSLVLKVAGLHTSANELSSVPEGALLEATNVDIVSDNVAQPRRGFERLSAGYATTTDRTAKTWFFQNVQFAHKGTYGSEDKVAYFSGGSWTNLTGTFSAPTGYKLRTSQSNSNLYYTTATGIYKLDTYNGTPVLAGAYKGLDLQSSLTGSSGFLEDTKSVAYRIVWGFRDANNNLLLGAPSQRSVVKNNVGGAATRDVSLTQTIPSGVTTSWIYQVYRSPQTTAAEPSDELQLVYEASPSAGEITAGTLTFTDLTPDSLRGAALYTNATQEGLANGNERPPLASDLAVFRDSTFFANTVSKHRFYLTLLAVGGTGLVADDTVTVAGTVYTAKASPVTDVQFTLSSGGTAAQNISDTARALCSTINRKSTATVYAYYLSGPDDTPGKILLEERSIGGASFAVTSSRAAAWNPPNLPQNSSNDTYPNGLYWSKPNQPEAVPLPNFVQVGNKDSAILKVVPLRDALVIFKEDGIYRLTGFYGSFSVELLDSSARLVGAETPAILNNQIFALTDQGVVVVSDGVKILSRPIEQDVLALFGDALDEVREQAFGVGYETERKYYLFLPASSAATYPTFAFVYNIFTNTWVKHEVAATCGVVEDTNLYLGDALSHYVLKDRKSYSFLDYADFAFSTSITTVNGLTLSISSGADEISVGDVLYQSSTCFAPVTAVDTIASTVTIASDPGFSVAAADVLAAISTRITWASVTNGNPGVLKQYHTTEVLFKTDFSGTAYLVFKSDLSQYEESVALQGSANGSWGLFAWGEVPWGGESLKRSLRQWVPRQKQRCSALTVSFEHSYGFSPWQLCGLTLFATPGTERTTRQ